MPRIVDFKSEMVDAYANYPLETDLEIEPSPMPLLFLTVLILEIQLL